MRFLTRFEQPILEAPGIMAQLILGANALVFGICFAQSETTEIATEVLLRNGAMSTGAIERHEYWRMIAYGFVHASPIHLAANMFLLVLWGGHLERRVGSLYFAFIYLSGLVAGAVVSKFTSPNSYLLVGAAGALSAVFGALLFLWASGKSEMGWEFFAISVGIVVALLAIHSRIDWGAHLRGLAAGMLCCGLLNMVEIVNGWLLRCKFPEFIKMNVFLAFAVVVVSGWAVLPSQVSQGHAWLNPVAAVLAGFAIVKAIDLALTIRKGLVLIVVVLALTNAVLVLLLKDRVVEGLLTLCGSALLGKYATQMPLSYACTDVDFTLTLVAIWTFVITLLVYWSHLARGIADVGFVGNALRAERLRYRGL